MRATNANLNDPAGVMRALYNENSELQQQLTTTMNELALMQLKYERVVCAVKNGWKLSLNEANDIIFD